MATIGATQSREIRPISKSGSSTHGRNGRLKRDICGIVFADGGFSLERCPQQHEVFFAQARRLNRGRSRSAIFDAPAFGLISLPGLIFLQGGKRRREPCFLYGIDDA